MITRISFLALTTAFSLVSRGASLVENVAAVEECRVAITNAIVSKGGTASGALTNAAAEIAALPSGGGDEWREWWMRPNWPNIREACSNAVPSGVVDQYPLRVSYLITGVKRGDYVALLASTDVMLSVSDGRWIEPNVSGYRLYFNDIPDGITTNVIITACAKSSKTNAFTLPNYNTDGWNDSYVNYGAVWVYGFSGEELIGEAGSKIPSYGGVIAWEHVHLRYNGAWTHPLVGSADALQSLVIVKDCVCENPNGSSSKFRTHNALVSITNCTFKSTNYASWFSDLNALECVDGVFDMDYNGVSSNGVGSLFSYSERIRHVPYIDFSRIYFAKSTFYNCQSLEKLQDEIVLTNIATQAGITSTFNGMRRLKRLPLHLQGPNKEYSYTISFEESTLVSTNSLATFSDGVMTGGMVYNLNDVTNDGGYTRTITLPNTLRAKFTSEEASTIISAANAKGWTLGNFAL